MGVTRADLQHCGKVQDEREELNRSAREGKKESRYFINSLVGKKSKSHDIGTELRIDSLTVHCDTFLSEKMLQ